jgi:hypothetical protein
MLAAAARVDHVVLATSTAREFSNPGSGGARHVLDAFSAGDQPLRQMPPQAARVLHCPAPVGDLAAQHSSWR